MNKKKEKTEHISKKYFLLKEEKKSLPLLELRQD